MSATKITIPNPCHENWQYMTYSEKGKFCGSCLKNVIDFTKSSDKEIAASFASHKNLCGRFLNSQLDRNLIIPAKKSTLWIAAASGLIAVLWPSEKINAQVQVPQVKVQTSDNDQRTIGKVLPPNQISRNVSGIISDANGPLPGANVVIKGTAICTQTDVDGKFAIKAKQGDTLVISHIETVESEYVISDHFNGITITLVNKKPITSTRIVLGMVAKFEAKPSMNNRTFFGRVFHSIGNLFR